MIHLTGLTVKEFIHPGEEKAWNALMRSPSIKNVLSWVNQQNTRLQLKTFLLGDAVRVSETDMPSLYHSVQNACDILDFFPVPQIYLHRSYKFQIKTYYEKTPVLVVPDCLLSFDEPMLMFFIGRSIAELKKEHVQLQTLLSAALLLVKLNPELGFFPIPPIASWMRAADLTADRGGLLTCQDFWTSEKCLLLMTGCPSKYLNPECIHTYVRSYGGVSKVADFSQQLWTMGKTKSWNNDRITELYQWESSGDYYDLLEEYE